MKVIFDVPPQMDLMCEMTMKELTKAQVAELINFGNAIQNMRKRKITCVYRSCAPSISPQWCLEEGIARTLFTIAQLMIVYRIDSDAIQSRLQAVWEERRWGMDE